MLDGIEKELAMFQNQMLSFQIKDCPMLSGVAIKVEKVTNYTVQGFIQHRIISNSCETVDKVRVKGTSIDGVRHDYRVVENSTANGRKVYIRVENIIAWCPAEIWEACIEKMPRRIDVREGDLNQF